MQWSVGGREVILAGCCLALGQPVRQVLEPIDQSDSQCDELYPLRLRGQVAFPSRACGEGQGGASARAEELRDLSGAVIAYQQATIGRLGDSQGMREPGCEIGDLPVLARTRPREHDAHDPPAGGTANVGAPLRDEGVIGIIRAKLGALVKGDAIRGRVRREYGDRRSDAGAAAMETAIGKSRPAT